MIFDEEFLTSCLPYDQPCEEMKREVDKLRQQKNQSVIFAQTSGVLKKSTYFSTFHFSSVEK
jgi:hypothetical protein